ncbi:MAG: hypothetical protein F4Y38_05780 [Gemmatimonadetes bacterium]|nr:hypothetical protein [Gemmatimonadota bacterium]MYG84671.1 hypothetical protein [Gemmatimonadota bacterium]MYJ90813.1 hypothetical protein [Gemmatimonadota bacterium]
MNKPQVLDHSEDFDQRISALESDMDAIKTNYEGLVGTLQKSFAKVEEDIQGIRDLIAKVIAHTNERFRSVDDKIQSLDGKIQSLDTRIQSTQVTLTGQIQSLNDKMDDRIQSLDDKIHSTRDDLEKSFRNDLRDFRREIKEDVREIKEDVKEDVRNSVNGLRWTVGIIVALAVAVMKLLP